MNIKKFDIETYYKTIGEHTTQEFLEDSVLCHTIDYDFKHINYLIPKDVYDELWSMTDDFLFNRKEFKLNELEKHFANYTFSIYKKRVAAKKLALIFVNLLYIKKKVRTPNGFNFRIKK